MSAASIEPPAFLRGPSLDHWRRLAPLEPDPGRAMALARYCVLLELFGEAVTFVRTHGSVMPVREKRKDGRFGAIIGMRELPAAAQVRALARLLDQAEGRLKPKASQLELPFEGGHSAKKPST